MTDPNIPVTEDELHAYVDNELPAERRGDVEAWLATHPDDAARVQSWRAMAEALHARYDSSPTRRCRSGSRSSGWCDSRANGCTARSPRRWWRSSSAAASAGWRVARPRRRPRFRIFTRGCAGRAPALCRRGPPSRGGARQRTRPSAAMADQALRLGGPCARTGAAGLKLVGGRLLPGPTGPASFLMYESAVRRTLHALHRRNRTPRRRRCDTPRKTAESSLYWSEDGVGYVVSAAPTAGG